MTSSIQSKSASAPSIFIDNASLQYQTKPLFSELSFTLPGEQWTALLGPSGVGKTSLLRLIAGLTVADSQVKSISTSDGFPLQNRIAYLAQTDLLLPWLSVRDNVLIGAKLRGQSKPKQELIQQADRLLEQLGLSKAVDMRPAQLSGGMRQRAALARTLLEDCPVVLMDEPFTALDMPTRLQLQNLAAELLRGRTVLLVTHDPLEALRLADNIFIMQGQPAVLTAPIKPKGNTPRSLTDVELLRLQAELLQNLSAAKEATPC